MNAAGQNKFPQRRKIGVQTVQRLFQRRHISGRHPRLAGQRKFAAQFKQAMLHRAQFIVHRGGRIAVTAGRPGKSGGQQADGAVQLVHAAHGLHPRVVLVHPAAGGEPGAAVVTGAGVNFGQAVAHGVFSVALAAAATGVKKFKKFLTRFFRRMYCPATGGMALPRRTAP